MMKPQRSVLQRRLENVLIAFFVLVSLSLVVVLVAAPSVYGQILSLPTATPAYPLLMLAFLAALLALITMLIVGVRRHWRWVFWIILLAFSAAVLDIPVTLLQLAGFLPNLFPVWYSLYRMGIACVQVGIAAWMWRISLQHGVWAMGRKSAVASKQPDLTNHGPVTYTGDTRSAEEKV